MTCLLNDCICDAWDALSPVAIHSSEVMKAWQPIYISFSSNISSNSTEPECQGHKIILFYSILHYRTCKEGQSLLKQGVTIFNLHCESMQMTWMQKKIPAQQWLKHQATCMRSLGTCHRNHTLTGMEFFYAFYHTSTSVASHGRKLIVYSIFYYLTRTCKDQGLLEQGVTILNLHCELSDLYVPSRVG